MTATLGLAKCPKTVYLGEQCWLLVLRVGNMAYHSWLRGTDGRLLVRPADVKAAKAAAAKIIKERPDGPCTIRWKADGRVFRFVL
jgi:hypothetical protein